MTGMKNENENEEFILIRKRRVPVRQNMIRFFEVPQQNVVGYNSRIVYGLVVRY
jgi:hypothetical protein